MEVLTLLQANTKKGDTVTLYQYSREEIEALRAREEFYCPVCKSKVIAKAGMKTIAHFAHQGEVNCNSNERGEGEYHEKGKLLLYNWLAAQGIQAEMEVYLSSIKQRADILVTIGNKRIAIEYQCARIPLQVIHQRTSGYINDGIQPIWIIGGNHFSRKGRNSMKVNQFLRQFFHRFTQKGLPTMYFFDPHTKIFIKAANLFPINQSRFYSDFSIRKLNQMHFLEWFTPTDFSEGQLLNMFSHAKRKFRINHPRITYGAERQWYKWLYSHGTHRDFLPSYIYLPVASQYQMVTSPWDWQSRVWLEIIAPLQIGEMFSLDDCMYILQKHITASKSPLWKGLDNPILEYLYQLVSLKVLAQSSNHTFQKRKEVQFYSHIEDALAGDLKIMEEISEILSQNTSMIR